MSNNVTDEGMQHSLSHERKHSQGRRHHELTKDMEKPQQTRNRRSAERRGVIEITGRDKEQTAYEHKLLRRESWEGSNSS